MKKINLPIKVPRFVQYAAAGISALAFGWYLFQQIAGRRDQRKYPPSGKLVEVGGFKLHFVPSGQGEPVVVLESGSGGFSLDWNQIQPQVAQVTRVCSYDRAGHGWSGASPRPHSIPNVVQDLHTLLESTRQKPPYLLVAHSLGGVYANYFARRYPSEVAGIIFVDAVHPEIYDYLPQVYHRQTQFELSKRWLSATSGLMRLGVLKPPAEGEAGRQRSALALRPAMWRTALDQNRHLKPGTDQLVEAAGPFPPIPVLVLPRKIIPGWPTSPQIYRQNGGLDRRSWRRFLHRAGSKWWQKPGTICSTSSPGWSPRRFWRWWRNCERKEGDAHEHPWTVYLPG